MTKHLSCPVPRESDLEAGPLVSNNQCYEQYLFDHGYAAGYIKRCKSGVAHLSRWMGFTQKKADEVGEALIAEFLDVHLPRCSCRSVLHDRSSLGTALGHLLAALRATGAIPLRATELTPIGEELRRYDKHMIEARNLVSSTRKVGLAVVGRLLFSCFGDGRINFPEIRAEHVRNFLIQQATLHNKPTSIRYVVSSLHSYFRWRTTLGDQVHSLIGVLVYPANWQLASLPKALKPEEVEQLVASLGQAGPLMRRADAMVRCALDLGLRSAEVARLSLDDIDWRAGTIALRGTKGRRDDVMPLPVSTGQAIVEYLSHERPKTKHRMLFARHVAPREQPIGPKVVRHSIRQAYARAGLKYTGSHLLRHTMASRLLAGGSSLKEVADVLRHRSLDTTLIYAKLDSRSLVKVALPWPGSAA
ncbi:site-specific integrase [Polaromonas sp. AET17H-212]|uniref:site-specific integrase n=1 Tax=Polaromonas sp. AET17H-212 TaxID=1977061 RepID=UPI000BBB82E1|nr:site-specific integrase [Polaromonas sp. AET17H-212]